MLQKYLFLTSVFGAIFNSEAARILAVYPCPSISHQVVFRPLTLELLKLGHQVTVVTPDPMFPKDGAPANLTEIDIHELYEFTQKMMAGNDEPDTLLDNNLLAAVAINYFVVVETQFAVKTKQFQELLNEIKTKKFDLLMIEALFTPMLALTHLTKAPTILVSSLGPFLGNYEIMGAPTTPLLYHHLFSNRLYNLTLWEKASELYNKLIIDLVTKLSEKITNYLLKNLFGPDTPPLNELRDNVDMLFVNLNPIWEGNYPVPPNVIHMGGLHQKPQKPLPQDLRQYLDASENGVIYFSFGTNVNTSILPLEKMAVFQKVFAELPYNVLWKMDNDNLPLKSDNVKIFKWLPQADLLRHPNIKMFITQGGLQSTDEAITAGVPLLGIPMMGDQRYNVEKYHHHKIGRKLMFQDITETTLKNTILEIVENKSYRDNIVRLRTLMQDQPQTPLERAIWWIQYVLRHGGAKHLRAPTANLSWTEYYEIELASYIVLFLFILITLIFLVIRALFLFIFKFSRANDKLKKS